MSSSESQQVVDQARFFAHELIARFERDLGEEIPLIIRDRMLFAAEMGYLRGHGEGMHAAIKMHDDVRKKVIDESE